MGVRDSELYVCDHASAATINGCERSTILLGPVKNDLVVSGCKDCTFVVAAWSLRVDNCSRCEFQSFCGNYTTVVGSEQLRFSQLDLASLYEGVEGHFDTTDLDLEDNYWHVITHESDEASGQPSYEVLPRTSREVRVPAAPSSTAMVPAGSPSGDICTPTPKNVADGLSPFVAAVCAEERATEGAGEEQEGSREGSVLFGPFKRINRTFPPGSVAGGNLEVRTRARAALSFRASVL